MATAYLQVNGGSGSGYHTVGTTVSVTASAPVTGYHFYSWTGTGQGYLVNRFASSTSLVMPSAAITISSNYVINTYTHHYYAGTGGHLTGTATQTGNYNTFGTEVCAVAESGYHFVNWSPGGVTSACRTDVFNGSVNLTANFEQNAVNTYALTVTDGTGDGTYASGTIVNIVADAPAPAHHFAFWSGDTAGIDDVNASSTHIHTQAFAATIVANYADDAAGFTLTYTAGTGGTIVGDAEQIVASGDDGTEVVATPIAGYYFVIWSDTVATAARTDLDVADDITVSATFAIIQSGYICWI